MRAAEAAGVGAGGSAEGVGSDRLAERHIMCRLRGQEVSKV